GASPRDGVPAARRDTARSRQRWPVGDRPIRSGRGRERASGRDERCPAGGLRRRCPCPLSSRAGALTARTIRHMDSGASASVIRVSNIRKTYGRMVAVDDVSFDVRDGEIFGLIGPNGAGKTTTMECIEGLRTPDRGTISVLGLDPVRDAAALHAKIGVQLQEAQLQKRIKVWEAVDLWASLYRQTVDSE